MSGGEPLFETFASRIRKLDTTRRRVDELVSSHHLSRQVAEQVYESLFLSCFTSFEVFLETVFLNLLVRRSQHSTNLTVVPRLTVKSFAVARELVIGPGRKYVDWLPWDKTVERANLFFRSGRPFTTVPAARFELVNKAHTIRNAIAHRSRHSQDKFERHVIAATNLAPRERRPASHLRGLMVAGPPPITRYESYATEIVGVAKLQV